MGVFAKRLLDYSASNLDNLVVGRLLGATTLGFYDKAFVTVDKVLGRINTGGPAVSFRVFAVIHEDRDRFRSAYRRVVLAIACVSFPILIGLAIAAPELITTMYGQRWASAVVPFQFLCVAGLFKVANEYAGSAAQAVGHIWSQVWRQAVYTGLIVVSVAALSPWGLRGAAIGVLVATVAMSILMHGLLIRITGMSVWDILLPQVPGVLATLAVSAAMVAARAAAAQTHLGGPAMLVSEAAAAVVAYAAFMKFNRFRDVRVLLRDAADDLGAPIGSIARLFA
jgi:O-antigen/teichoic acid export membrane protein